MNYGFRPALIGLGLLISAVPAFAGPLSLDFHAAASGGGRIAQYVSGDAVVWQRYASDGSRLFAGASSLSGGGDISVSDLGGYAYVLGVASNGAMLGVVYPASGSGGQYVIWSNPSAAPRYLGVSAASAFRYGISSAGVFISSLDGVTTRYDLQGIAHEQVLGGSSFFARSITDDGDISGTSLAGPGIARADGSFESRAGAGWLQPDGTLIYEVANQISLPDASGVPQGYEVKSLVHGSMPLERPTGYFGSQTYRGAAGGIITGRIEQLFDINFGGPIGKSSDGIWMNGEFTPIAQMSFSGLQEGFRPSSLGSIDQNGRIAFSMVNPSNGAGLIGYATVVVPEVPALTLYLVGIGVVGILIVARKTG